MNDDILNNIVTSTGTYDGSTLDLTSNILNVTIVKGLTITQTADKSVWADGVLNISVVVENNATSSYENPILSDVLDTTLVSFIDGSVKIDGVVAGEEDYNYDTSTNTLTVNLDTIATGSSKTVTFQVEKVS